MSVTEPVAGGPNRAFAPYRVMLVDDSAIVRGILSRMLEADPEIVIEARASDGQMALDLARRHELDVIVLDVEMPVMDGITALPKLIEAAPHARVIMASTLTRRNAEISLRALALGAAECLAKPTSGSELRGSDEFRSELTAKVKALGAAARRAAGRDRPAVKTPRRKPMPERSTPHGGALREAPRRAPAAIAIGSSTGGPQALHRVLTAFGPAIDQPVFITQHMPATFTAILAEHLAKASGLACAEAVNGEPVRPGRVYIAPGDFHMVVETAGAGPVLRLRQTPPENFCRPSADPMLASLARVYGQRILAIILTGMGADGLKGADAVVRAGGAVLAQDEDTSVVWGMPGAVANAGLCCAVLPIDDIGAWVKRVAAGDGDERR